MHLNDLSLMLALAPTPSEGQQTAPFYIQLFPFVLLLVVFYVLLIRPQQKKAKEHANLLKTIRPGDKIVTASGIMGVILTVKERSVTLRSADSKLEILKSAVSEIIERGGESSES